MTLLFKGAALRPVIAEAIANGCRLALVKDQGVYILAEKGECRPDGRRALIAYAQGCNPDVDAFDDWWERARAEVGGDDFVEYLDPKEQIFSRVQNSDDDLEITATITELSLEATSH